MFIIIIAATINIILINFHSDTPGKVKNVSSERNYSSNTLITLWDPLPSLDLTNIDPDIVYSVDLVKVTCGENISVSHKVVSVSNAVEENLDLMQIYKATIVARNNVITARNGPSVVVEGNIMNNNNKYVVSQKKKNNPMKNVFYSSARNLCRYKILRFLQLS